MLQAQAAVYLGIEKDGSYVDFIAESKYFLAVEFAQDITKEEGTQIISVLKSKLHTSVIEHLAQLDSVVTGFMKEINAPASMSIAMGVWNKGVLFLKTVNEGEVYLNRGPQFVRIIGGNQTASGYIQENDIVIFTTKHFSDLANRQHILQSLFNGRKSREIVDALILQLNESEYAGTISLFVSFEKAPEVTREPVVYATPEEFVQAEEIVPAAAQAKATGRKKRFALPLISVPSLFDKGKPENHPPEETTAKPKKKYVFTVVIVTIIFGILIWSVVLGVQRRRNEAMVKRIQTVKEDISKKLSEAEDVAFLNMSKSLSLINDAKTEYETLKTETDTAHQKDLVPIQQLISQKEDLIVKKEDKSYEEFYDLSVDSKEASGSRMYVADDTAYILDNTNGNIYQLSLSKKSLDKQSAGELKNAKLLSINDDNLYFFSPGQGVYQLKDSKVKKVVPADNEWRNVVDMQMYSGNIYMLDTGASEIFKYPGTDNGFGEKVAYFKGGAQGLSSATSMAIDSSVYVSVGDKVLKFTAGAADEFKTTFPDAGAQVLKVIASKDLSNIYGWDQNKGTIYILEKNGTYVKQVQSSILKKANDVIIFEKNAYILVGQKIYRIGIE